MLIDATSTCHAGYVLRRAVRRAMTNGEFVAYHRNRSDLPVRRKDTTMPAKSFSDQITMPIEVTYDHDAGRWYVRTTNPDNLRECSDPYEAVEVVREFTLRQREIAIEALRDAPEAPAGPAVGDRVQWIGVAHTDAGPAPAGSLVGEVARRWSPQGVDTVKVRWRNTADGRTGVDVCTIAEFGSSWEPAPAGTRVPVVATAGASTRPEEVGPKDCTCWATSRNGCPQHYVR